MRAFCAEFPSRIDQFEALLTNNEIFLQRTKGVGIVSRERLLALGVTGPLLRAAGEPWDLRKADPYLAYGEFDFNVPIGTVGDGWDRFRVPDPGDARVGADHRAGARRPARGPRAGRRPQDRPAARGTSWAPRWRR